MPAQAHGWRAVALPDVPYPGLIAAPGTATVDGFTLTDLTTDEWHLLDAFEDDVYELALLTLTDNGTAWAYTCTDTTSSDAGEWSAAAFVEQHLTNYVTRCSAWRYRHDTETAARTAG